MHLYLCASIFNFILVFMIEAGSTLLKSDLITPSALTISPISQHIIIGNSQGGLDLINIQHKTISKHKIGDQAIVFAEWTQQGIIAADASGRILLYDHYLQGIKWSLCTNVNISSMAVLPNQYLCITDGSIIMEYSMQTLTNIRNITLNNHQVQANQGKGDADEVSDKIAGITYTFDKRLAFAVESNLDYPAVYFYQGEQLVARVYLKQMWGINIQKIIPNGIQKVVALGENGIVEEINADTSIISKEIERGVQMVSPIRAKASQKVEGMYLIVNYRVYALMPSYQLTSADLPPLNSQPVAMDCVHQLHSTCFAVVEGNGEFVFQCWDSGGISTVQSFVLLAILILLVIIGLIGFFPLVNWHRLKKQRVSQEVSANIALENDKLIPQQPKYAFFWSTQISQSKELDVDQVISAHIINIEYPIVVYHPPVEAVHAQTTSGNTSSKRKFLGNSQSNSSHTQMYSGIGQS